MRQAQKAYFQLRSASTLDRAKTMERRVDYHLTQVFQKYGYPIGSLPLKKSE